jgi:adenylylsulfate kinase-like enzyme
MNTGCSILIITGPVGAGKTTIAESIFDLLSEKKTPCAVIDFDWLTAAYPPPLNDRFNFDLGIANLRSILPNYLSMGIKKFIIPTVIESKEEIEKFKALINETDIFVVRLLAELPTLHRRLDNRERGTMLNWHKKRAKELIDIFAVKQLENVIVDTENKSIDSITEEVLHFWPKNRL